MGDKWPGAINTSICFRVTRRERSFHNRSFREIQFGGDKDSRLSATIKLECRTNSWIGVRGTA
jgi:hypothetical protein